MKEKTIIKIVILLLLLNLIVGLIHIYLVSVHGAKISLIYDQLLEWEVVNE